MSRILTVTAVAIALLCAAAAGAWFAMVHGVADAVGSQVRVAGEQLDAGDAIDARLARALLRPGLRIVLIDRGRGVLLDADGGGVHERPLPPPQPPGSAPENERPPNGAPNAPPRPSPFVTIALALAHVPPVDVQRGGRVVRVGADGVYLARRLAGGIAVLAALIALACAAGAQRAAQRTRAERRRLEADVVERRAAAERYQRFLAETGHELRTPLTVMSGYVEILRNHRDGAPIDPRVIEGLQAETARMRLLVEKMMTLARLEADAGVARLIDVAQAARDAVETARRRFADREVTVEVARTASIVIDADDYAAALGNLVENAVKYAPDSPILVETDILDGQAVTSVIDRGPGVAPDDRRAIFDRFRRGRRAPGRDGLGIGLSIVKRVADRWNGFVTLESIDGCTTFSLSFPVADEESHAVPR
jgi:signal transduction histidine kinase